MSHRNFTTHPIVVRRLEVCRVVDVTPRMRRITLTGSQLREFERGGMRMPAFASTGFDDHVKLVFATNGDVESVLPVQRARGIDWLPCEGRETRDYTPRRFDAEAGELELDFVMHGDGPAASWAARAKPGDPLHTVGPKSSIVLPEDIDRVVLVGDETALPAIGRFFDERPTAVGADVVIAVGDEAARQEFALRDEDTLSWVTPEALIPAVQALAWAERPFVWAGAESRALLPLRRWLKREKRHPKSHTDITGYWHAEAEPEQVEDAAQGVGVEALLSPVPWFAVRAAVRVGLLESVERAPGTVAELAERLELQVDALGPLVDLLVGLGILGSGQAGDSVPGGPVGRLRLAELGELVLADDHVRAAFDDTVEARAIEALLYLPEQLRDGVDPFVRAHGSTAATLLESDHCDEHAESVIGLDFVASALCEIAEVRSAHRIAVTGPGARAVSAALEAQELVEADCEPEVALLASALGHRVDADARTVIRAVTAPRMVVVEEMPPRSTDPEEAEHALIAMATRGPRELAGLRALAEAEGWRQVSHTSLGWRYEALVFDRA
ncbi:siderophore-interacting protein [Occultella kanbiaonis]|uniref:siderophore-interacting protein n=1 Tax=Occultella kanbiaonis TaxID=2675754 RepID=UPI0013D1C10C|nr:siderophore-interacting protein [Occultella kanbiaonis]